MSYTRDDIPAMIAVFKAAKKNLSNNPPTKFLCHALARTGHSPSVVLRAKRLVSDAIDQFSTLGSYYDYDRSVYPCSGKREIALRIQWCDKIIRDLKEYAK